MIQQTVNEKAAALNSKVDKVSAATKSQDSQVHDILADETVTDPEIVKWREYDAKVAEAREAARAKIGEHVKANHLKNETLTDEQTAALKDEIKALRAEVNAGLTFAKSLPTYSAETFTEPEVKSLRGSGSSGGGTGGKRPRLEWIKVNGQNATVTRKNPKGEEVEVQNFGTAAAVIAKDSDSKVGPKDLQAAAFETAGTDDLSTVGGKAFSFAFTAGDKSYDVEFMPRAGE
jgi:hypothetical protein